jgi:hypothetical protein
MVVGPTVFRSPEEATFPCILSSYFLQDPSSEVLISPKPDQEGNKLQQQKLLSFIYPICNHDGRNISTIYIYNKTGIKRNILTIKQNTSGSRSSEGLVNTPVASFRLFCYMWCVNCL